MGSIETLLLTFQILVAVCLVGFILLQHGKGADAGAAFGSGASSTVFGSRGSGNFLTRSTTVLAILFLANSLLLGYLATQDADQQGSLMEQEESLIIRQEMIKEQIEDIIPAEPTAPVSDIPVIQEE